MDDFVAYQSRQGPDLGPESGQSDPEIGPVTAIEDMVHIAVDPGMPEDQVVLVSAALFAERFQAAMEQLRQHFIELGAKLRPLQLALEQQRDFPAVVGHSRHTIGQAELRRDRRRHPR